MCVCVCTRGYVHLTLVEKKGAALLFNMIITTCDLDEQDVIEGDY